MSIEHCALILGLTGPSGAGKTTAARMLEALGCAVIDCDLLAREIVLPGAPVLQKLAERFGDDILCEGGALDRALLARRAFESEKARRDLNSITHPAITNLAMQRMEALQGFKAIVLDAAALLESELADLCGHILIITAPEDLRLQRIAARGGTGGEAARRRVEAQRHMDYTGAGYIIINNEGSEAALQNEIEKAFRAVAGGPGDPLGGVAAALPPAD